MSDDELPKLRRLFAHEAKRNLFQAYLRPQETLIKLVSHSSSSSAAFPGGEAFHFAFSPNGQYILAYSTSRIHVLHVADEELSVQRELKILRRPAAVFILDDGSRLAVLSKDHRLDLYDLQPEQPPKKIKTIELDHNPRTISLSPCGSVLAAAYDGGIEVHSLAGTTNETIKRGVKSDAADHLSFSGDGTQLLGTTSTSKTPSSVILSAPYFDPGEHDPEHRISSLWNTSILFPHSSRDCSHAVFLPNHGDYEVNWAFTFDRVFETFRAVRIDDLRNGTTYFTGPLPVTSSKLLPSTLPTSTIAGDLVASGFEGKDIWCYGVPENLDAPQDVLQSSPALIEADLASNTQSLSPTEAGPSSGLRTSNTWPKESPTARAPKWQVLCDKARNAFVPGHKLSVGFPGITGLKWIQTVPKSPCERLLAVAPGGLTQSTNMAWEDEDSMGAMDGGRLLLLDFRYSVMNGRKHEDTIVVGEIEPDVLEEEHRDLETEVAIVRRRTVAQNSAYQHTIARSATSAVHRNGNPLMAARSGAVPPLPRIPSNRSTRKVALASMEERSETSSIVSVDEQEALELPYEHGAPRSGTTLRRAATAAAVNRVFQPVLRGPQAPPLRIRAADGRGELPHESDADNWVPPPPAYHDLMRDDERQARAVAPLPEHVRTAVLAGGIPSSTSTSLRRSSTVRTNASGESDILMSLQRTRTMHSTHGRTPAESPSLTTARPRSAGSDVSAASDPGPTSVGVVPSETATLPYDIYGVSPPRTPEPPNQMDPPPETPVNLPFPRAPPPLHQVTRRPVPQPARINTITETIPEIPPVNIQTAIPVSPRPRHVAFSTISTVTENWHGAVAQSCEAQPSNLRDPSRRLSGSSTLTQARLEADMPPRPNDDHRITDLPPSEPVTPMASYAPNGLAEVLPPVSGEPVPPGTANSGHEALTGDFSMPSASQLTRLNSRTGRPKNRMIDPSRRGSGQFSRNPSNPNQYTQAPAMAPRGPPPQLPPRQNGPPRVAAGAHVVAPIYPAYHDMANSFAGQLRQRGMSEATFHEGMRPPMSRLETIHSVGSNADAAAQLASARRPTIVGVSRNTSRAERSAAINIQEAKRRGWGGTKREKKKKKDKDGASSAGWTDVSREFGEEGPMPKKKGGACKMM